MGHELRDNLISFFSIQQEHKLKNRIKLHQPKKIKNQLLKQLIKRFKQTIITKNSEILMITIYLIMTIKIPFKCPLPLFHLVYATTIYATSTFSVQVLQMHKNQLKKKRGKKTRMAYAIDEFVPPNWLIFNGENPKKINQKNWEKMRNRERVKTLLKGMTLAKAKWALRFGIDNGRVKQTAFARFSSKGFFTISYNILIIFSIVFSVRIWSLHLLRFLLWSSFSRQLCFLSRSRMNKWKFVLVNLGMFYCSTY